jgi:hypothetical protein
MHNTQYTSKQIPILKSQLKEILSKEKDGVVISLQGSWGIGKTFFWNDFATQTWNENQQVYISLFGKHSLDDIKKQIVLKIYDSNKVANFLEKHPIIGKAIESKWGVDTSMIASSFTKETFEGIVLCFDDFERISPKLSISEVLGFISELKEQNRCKIVLINNNDSLKEYDELNHKKVLKKHQLKKDKDTSFLEECKYGEVLKEYKTEEKFFISQTNNQEIFDKFSEKIIDFRLYYEPHYIDNLSLVKDEALSFVKWELVEELLSQVNDNNKQCNIRLMKQLISKLKLFSNVLNDEINERISNSIVFEVFKNIYQFQGLEIVNFLLTDISGFRQLIISAIKKHYLEEESFKEIINNLNEKINSSVENTNVYDNTYSLYNKFLYDLSYSDNDFAKEIYDIFHKNKKNIVQILGLKSFKWFIELLIKTDESKQKKFDKLYEKSAKKYIDYLIKDEKVEEHLHFEIDEIMSIINENDTLALYYKEEKEKLETQDASDITVVIKTMTDVRKNRGWGPKDENLLKSISVTQQKKWIEEDPSYLETAFAFARWSKGFSGDKPFGIFNKNFLEAIEILNENKEYKNKLTLMLNFFGVS